MVVFQIYSCSINREIFAPVCHVATLFSIALSISTLFVPFLIAYRSGGFWQQDLTYFEQPSVRFSRQIYCELSGPSGVNTWSTFTDLNSQMVHTLSVPRMTVIEQDEDGDGLNDKMNLRLEFPDIENITRAYVLLLFHLELRDKAKLFMKAPVTVEHEVPSALAGNYFYQVGSLVLYQSHPLIQNLLDNQYNNSIFDEQRHSIHDAQPYSVHSFLSKREVSVSLDNQHTLWLPGSSGSDDPTVLNITVLYSPLKITVIIFF
ncbi:unnamed protein product [Calicophoron daubneyi]|uniref:Transmembrane protein 231 n=1 Tax=Calicophoron daubneyi TaxID=300641 RepID=A0AAV2T855_CALDB